MLNEKGAWFKHLTGNRNNAKNRLATRGCGFLEDELQDALRRQSEELANPRLLRQV